MRRALVPLALLALLFAGCGETEIDADKAETFIAKTVEEQVGARVESVDCPSGLKAKKGETFECTVTGDDDSSGDTAVTEKDDEGNVSVSAPFIHVRDLEDQIASSVQDQVGRAVDIECPEIIVGEKGGTFKCEATAGKNKRVIEVTQKDDQGNVRFEIVDA